MKIIELLQNFTNDKVQNTKVNPTAVVDYLTDNLEIIDYLPFEEKRELCVGVVNGSCKMVGSIVEVDSISRYILFTIAVLSRYTNLEFDISENPMADYDVLCQSGLLDYILEAIGDEYTTCNNMLNMMINDITINNNNAAAVFDKSAQRVLDALDGFINVLSDKVNELNLDLSQIDLAQYEDLIKKLTK